eukprot:CAMPEP_0174234522 /NCGR_PEP_ID=MMETSP0417-20130205/4250_1 /TAXON_ID=242541 /ORGANISM="Mayorella sp, Strain BSH-02190019" /LENGTH=609 /DNA_ID=CAMNT_0015312895 /DNA_START=29 /DNA_END=1855 /DNA_ORIENTATION=-
MSDTSNVAADAAAKPHTTRYVVTNGGVLSGLGKGVINSSVGLLFRAMGYNVTAIKIDPYLNVDAGTMSPFEHGEVFVLDDGGEADLDLGNYERFMDIRLGRDNNITTGKIYKAVIEKERQGKYLGKTVQVIPHICNEIQDWIERVAKVPAVPLRYRPTEEAAEALGTCAAADDSSSSSSSNSAGGGDSEQQTESSGPPPDICVIELGGTVGDIESSPFIEALRQFQFRVGVENFCSIHVSLVPQLGVVGEQKTKPTQHSVRTVRGLGLSPDVIVCRSSEPLTADTKRKISMHCHVPPASVLGCHDVTNIFHVPLLLQSQGLMQVLCRRLSLPVPPLQDECLAAWGRFADHVDEVRENGGPPVVIAIVGKYTGLADSYLSVIKALQHASLQANKPLQIRWICSDDLQEEVQNPAAATLTAAQKEQAHKLYVESWKALRSADGVLVPGGFGDRGVEGKVAAIRYARKQQVPFLGICLGMQAAVIEYARNVAGLKNAHSEEMSKDTPHKVVIFMPEISRTHMGGTMRLGTRRSLFKCDDSITGRLYGGVKYIDERHRHRYEVNPEYVPQLEEAGLRFVAQDETGKRMEVIELKEDDHPFFVATQAHPEFKSR